MQLPRRRFILLIGMPIIIFGAAIPFAAFRWMVPRDPLNANMVQLGRWLATYDVSDETLKVQQQLVDRIQSSLPALSKSTASEHHLSTSQQDRLLANAERLQQVWFEQRTRQGSALKGNPQRVEFFRKQVASLLEMAELANRLVTKEGSRKDGDSMREFLANVAQWQSDASPNLRQAMKDTVRDGLLVYLAYFDVGDISLGSRRALAVRTAHSLDTPGRPNTPPVKFEGPARKTLQRNAELLMEGWFHTQAGDFDGKPTVEKTTFVIDLVARVKAWDLPVLLSAGGSKEETDQTKILLRLNEQIDVWIERAEPVVKLKMQALADAVRQQLVWDSLKGLVPFLGEQK
ncbi:MAG: hypothetical protein ABGX22_01285 [Pirellulaceae bacterium]|nr:hypothetical protein [Planctomycetaceae bacterium]